MGPRVKPYGMHASRFEARALLPQLAGEGGPEGRMGYGPLLRSRQACATIRASLRQRVPAFHTPSAGLRPTPSPLRGEGVRNRLIFEREQLRSRRTRGATQMCECRRVKPAGDGKGNDSTSANPALAAAAGSFRPPALARFRHGRRFQRHRRIDDGCVFAVQMRERQRVDVLGRPAPAAEIDLVDRP
jgi:hypothetical protein